MKVRLKHDKIIIFFIYWDLIPVYGGLVSEGTEHNKNYPHLHQRCSERAILDHDFKADRTWNSPARRILDLSQSEIKSAPAGGCIYIPMSCYNQFYSTGMFSCRVNLISCSMSSRRFIKIDQVTLRQGSLYLHCSAHHFCYFTCGTKQPHLAWE